MQDQLVEWHEVADGVDNEQADSISVAMGALEEKLLAAVAARNAAWSNFDAEARLAWDDLIQDLRYEEYTEETRPVRAI